MMRRHIWAVMFAAASLGAQASLAQEEYVGSYSSGAYATTAPYATGSYGVPFNWHAGYYHVAWGRPLALVVPPTATFQTNYGWGVGNTRVTPIYHQYLGPMYGEPAGYGDFRPTPYHVSDTLQFGVYYIRGPW